MTIRVLIIVCALLFGGGAHAAEDGEALRLSDSIGTAEAAPVSFPNPIQNLLQFALNQDGVSYRRGGTSPESGFDCSGFVRYVFDQIGGVALPHSAKAISKLGSSIKITALQPGDLVFFRIVRHAISHVGIYLGNNQFIHASSISTGGVRISNLTDSYWVKRFTLARRLDIPDEQSASISGSSISE